MVRLRCPFRCETSVVQCSARGVTDPQISVTIVRDVIESPGSLRLEDWTPVKATTSIQSGLSKSVIILLNGADNILLDYYTKPRQGIPALPAAPLSASDRATARLSPTTHDLITTVRFRLTTSYDVGVSCRKRSVVMPQL